MNEDSNLQGVLIMSKGTAEAKKPEAQQQAAAKPAAPAPTKGKKHEVVAGHCAAQGCKKEDKRFSFCDEHYEWFKFGLVKKTGEMAPDFDKKYEHFLAFQRKQGARKAA